ncbi:MAG: hypothetical protein ACO3M9_00590 [Flavobacteriaceae bacterium]
MKLFYRLGYYLVGFSLGLIILTFVFSGKKTTCNYGPEARVIGDLAKKKVVIAPLVKELYPNFDSLAYHQALQKASVDFGASTRGLDSCKTYQLQAYWQEKPILLYVLNCEKTVTLERLNYR